MNPDLSATMFTGRSVVSSYNLTNVRVRDDLPLCRHPFHHPDGLHGNPCRPYPFLIDHLEQGLCNLAAMFFEVELYGRESRRGYVAHELVVVDTKEGNVIRNPDSL